MKMCVIFLNILFYSWQPVVIVHFEHYVPERHHSEEEKKVSISVSVAKRLKWTHVPPRTVWLQLFFVAVVRLYLTI